MIDEINLYVKEAKRILANSKDKDTKLCEIRQLFKRNLLMELRENQKVKKWKIF